MPRFLSPDWVGAFNDALAGAALDPAAASVADGTLRVAQVVIDPPSDLLALVGVSEIEPHGGVRRSVRTVMTVHDGRVHLAHQPPEHPDGASEADVSVVISYPDAVALSRGELDPVDALGAGRVQIRGNLAALVASQSLLASAAGLLEGLHATTTY